MSGATVKHPVEVRERNRRIGRLLLLAVLLYFTAAAVFMIVY